MLYQVVKWKLYSGFYCRYGKKPNGQIALVFNPVDKFGSQIKTKLLGNLNSSLVDIQDGWDGIDNTIEMSSRMSSIYRILRFKNISQ